MEILFIYSYLYEFVYFYQQARARVIQQRILTVANYDDNGDEDM